MFSGSSLSICRSEGAQCCSDDYLEEVKEKVQDKLEDYLEEEFEDVIEEYEDEIEDLMECEFPYVLSIGCLYQNINVYLYCLRKVDNDRNIATSYHQFSWTTG